MMDMEMNAGLDGDDGSEASQPCSEGSSASSTFCNLEKDYSRIMKEMKTNEALSPFEAEYTRLFECLYKAHSSEKELSNKCLLLEEEIGDHAIKVYELTRTVLSNAEEMESMKMEIVNATKLADAAHTREQNAQEVIENLKLNLSKLTQEIELKNRLLADDQETTASKQKEGLMKEREKLVNEVETLRQRLKNMSVYTDELERKTSVIDHQMNEMQENLDMQQNEISKEKRARQTMEDEMQQMEEELSGKISDLENANTTIQAAAANVMKLENLLKEQRVSHDKIQKDLSKMTVKGLNMQTDLDNANVQIENLEKEIATKDIILSGLKQSLSRAKDEMSKSKIEREWMQKKTQKLEIDCSKTNEELRQTEIKFKNTEHQVISLRKQQLEKEQYITNMLREKNVLARSKETTKEHMKRLNYELVLIENSRKKIEQELDISIRTIFTSKRQIDRLEKERDRYNSEAQELAQQVESYINDIKLKQVEIFDYKKRLAEVETRYRQQQNLFEVIRAERNYYSKSLIEAQDEIQELKNKLKTVSHQVEQMKEDVATKEANLVKEEFLLGRVEKEKETLKVELQSSRKDVTELRREIEKMKQEEKGLRQVIQQAEADIGRHRKDIDNVMNERDILGTQLVRRNDELSLQFSRIQVLNGNLERGETQYNQRLEDIRLLKLEVKKLRTEKILLTKNIANIADLRQEIFHMNRDLTKERLKVTALEEEVQTPLNVHRWRKLEGSDPTTHDMLKKIQILQKRVLKMASAMIEKEKKVKDTEKLYMNLREILTTHPGPQVVISLNKTQKALRERGKQMKCLIAEVSMYEVQVGEYKMDIERMNDEMSDLKKKYYNQKRKLQKSAETQVKSTSEPIFPAVTLSKKKFSGGGFNMTPPTPRNSLAIDSIGR